MEGAPMVVCVTASSESEAALIAKSLVHQKLAACVNIIPAVRSIYVWEGELCDDREWLLVIKTQRALFDTLCATVSSLHSYDTPEVIGLPITAIEKAYGAWLDSATTK